MTERMASPCKICHSACKPNCLAMKVKEHSIGRSEHHGQELTLMREAHVKRALAATSAASLPDWPVWMGTQPNTRLPSPVKVGHLDQNLNDDGMVRRKKIHWNSARDFGSVRK